MSVENGLSGMPVSGERSEKKKIVIVDNVEALETEARDVAEAALTEDTSKSKKKGFLKNAVEKTKQLGSRIWKHNLFHEYYRQKEIALARKRIIDTGNLYAAETNDTEAHAEAMSALLERFAGEEDELLHKDAGEERRKLNTAEEGADKDLSVSLSSLLKEYAAGRLNDEAFVEERVRLVSQATGLSDKKIKEKVSHADNIFEIASELRQAVEHGARLDDLDFDYEVIVGKAKSGVRTEANFNKVDKLLEKVQKLPLGKYLNETTVASSVAIVYSLAGWGTKKLLNSKLSAWGSFGLTAIAGGAFAGARESKRLKEERRQHSREMAKGKQFEGANAPRRRQMEEFRYETKAASESTAQLNGYLSKAMLSLDDLSAATGALAEIEARIALSDRQNIDLISFSDARTIEKERLDLDIARAKLKVKLANASTEGFPPEGQEFSNFLDTTVAARRTNLLQGADGKGGIEQKDSNFKKMSRKRVAGAVVKGVLSGLVVGSTVQEVGSLLRDDQVGLIEAWGGKGESSVNTTALGRLGEYLHSSPGAAEGIKVPSSAMFETLKVDDGNIKLPADLDFAPDPNHAGNYILTKDGRVISDNLSFNNGQFSTESLEHLREAGIGATVDVKTMTTEMGVTGTSPEYIEKHPELFTHIKRDMWYDNNTPKVFEKNELKLHWGGGGDGIDENGNYVFNVAHLTNAGSTHKGFSVEALNAMKEGKLKMLFSLSRDTQGQVVEVPIDANGNAVIDPNSETGKMFFGTEGNKAVFLGKYAEIGESMGKDENGADHFRVLATHVGKDAPNLPSSLPMPKDEVITILGVPNEDLPPAVADRILDMPPVIPMFGRRPLERNRQGLDMLPPYFYGGRENIGDRERMREMMSERIKDNADADLDAYEEAEEYLEKQDEAYRQELEALVAQTEAMDKDCELSICIPAAGHQEGSNIYESLKNYSYQTADPKSFEVVVLVNTPDIDPSGNPVQSDGTLAEVERLKKDFPSLNIRVMNVVVPREKAKIGYARKLLNDATLLRHVMRGKIKDRPDLVMVSNDADNKGMSPEYVDNFIKKFKAHKNVDAMLGQLDWDPESYVRNPLVHVGTRMFQYVDLLIRSKNKAHIPSPGANFAFKSSIYAAVGGYGADDTLAEDVDLGRRIKLARKNAHSHQGIVYAGARVSRMYTSSRRAENAIRNNLSPVEQWERTFSAFDDEVRKTDFSALAENIDYDNPEDVKKVIKGVEGVANRTIKAMKRWTDGDQAIFTRALGLLGVKYRIKPDGNIAITDADRLIEGLKQYRAEGLNLMMRKAGKQAV